MTTWAKSFLGNLLGTTGMGEWLDWRACCTGGKEGKLVNQLPPFAASEKDMPEGNENIFSL